MSSRKLRKRLSNILKEKGYGKLYTCKKRKFFKQVSSPYLRAMILFFENVKPGLQVNEWGINHTVIEEPTPIWWNVGTGNGGYYWKIDQIQYSNNYRSCGCGSYYCFIQDNSVKTKQEIVDSFKNSNGHFAKNYFKLLEQGIDILDENGFIISNYKDYI